MKQLSIVIVNYNVKHFLEQTLTSVFKALKNVDGEVFVVDNNSADDSVKMLKERFPQVILIENNENIGFSKANNQAIRNCNSKYILLLNPDTLVEEKTFEKCLFFMENHSDCGGLGVQMVDGSGKFLPESKRGLPTPDVAFYKMFGLSKLFPKSKFFGKYHLTYLNKNETHEIDVLSGAFMFLRKETLDKCGLLDEDFFMYGEDIDLSYRITKAGYKNYYFHDTRIIHYKGESTKKSSVNYVRIFYKAMTIFAEKHFSSSNAALLRVFIYSAIYLRAFIALFSRQLQRLILPLTDAMSIYIGMYFLKTYWENNHKWAPGKYPDEYMFIVVPIYIVFWIGTSYLSGVYDKPFKISKVIKGVIIGGLLISAISNFVDSFRFSKALIILGTIYSAFSIVFLRYIIQFIKTKRFSVDEEPSKRIALVGSMPETSRISAVLQSKSELNLVGNIYINESESDSNSLGNINRLNELIEIYKLDELIFCAKDMPSSQIIEWMTSAYNRQVDFRIVPDDSNFVIGSNSKNTQGDYYSFEIELKLNNSEKIREKRMFDILFSLMVICFSPLLIFTKNKFNNLIFATQVLFGKKNWVSTNKSSLSKYRLKKQGVFTTTSSLKNVEPTMIEKLDFLYAKDFSVMKDLDIILSNI